MSPKLLPIYQDHLTYPMVIRINGVTRIVEWSGLKIKQFDKTIWLLENAAKAKKN